MSMNDYYKTLPVPKHIEYALKELAEAVEYVNSACTRATKLSDDFHPVRELQTYDPLTEQLRKRLEYQNESALNAAYQACQPIREKNLKAIEENRALKEKLQALFVSLNVPTKRVNMNPSRVWNAKARWQETGWPNSIAAIPVDDGWAGLERQYKDTLKALEEDKEKKARAREQEEAERQRTEKKRRDTVALGLLATQLGLDPLAEAYEVRKALLGRNKYLRLADAMYRTRCDWSDGPYRVADALANFSRETEEDHRIALQLEGHVEDWCGDGRIFRDCQHNYDSLFDLVKATDPNLWEMYEKFREIEGEDA